MATYPAPSGSLLTPAQRDAVRQIEAVLAENGYDQHRINPCVPDLVQRMAAVCATGAERGGMADELDRIVRWHRLPGHWLSFLFQSAMQQVGDPVYFVFGCLLYSNAQINATSDLALNSVENAYNVLTQRQAQGEDEAVHRAAEGLRGHMRLVFAYYRRWYRSDSSRDINPLTEHLYGEKTRGDLVAAFPELDKPSAQLAPGDYLAVIARCIGVDGGFCRVVARRFLGSVHQGRGESEAAAEQLRLGLEEAQALGLDTEIGHFHRLYGHALRQRGRLAEAAEQFEAAYQHEAPAEYGYWQALSARELGDVRLQAAPRDADPQRPPQEMVPALAAYRGGRLMFEANLGMGVVPVARAVSQQMFRSYTDNALQAAWLLQSAPDVLAEWEAAGPRYATEVVAEGRAATALASEVQAQFRAARGVFHQSLGAFNPQGDLDQDFDAYLASVGEHRAARRLYQQARIALTAPVTHAQLSDEIAEKITALRLPGAAFLLTHVGDRQTALTLLDVGSGRPAATGILPMGEAEWRAGHEAYHRAVQGARGLPDPAVGMCKALGALLHFYEDALGPPLEAFMPFLRGRHLKIFPHLFMNEVPFHALTVGGRPLIEHCETVSYAQTLGLFLQVHRPGSGPAARRLAVLSDDVGAPYYQGTLASLAPFYGNDLRVSRDPSWAEALAAFREQRPTDILFACHGVYDPDVPADSRLLLNASELNASGSVSFAGIFTDLDLRECDCVTLGACESGLGRTIVTAEFLGLPTAFFAAGARYVIGSLWKIHQVAAAILLDRHYQLLKEGGRTVPSALNEAERTLRQMAQEQVIAWLQTNLPDRAEVVIPVIRRLGELPFAHPYYWAGFYAAGDV